MSAINAVLLLLALARPLAAAGILMVADEIPAMEVLSKQLATRAGNTTAITTQDKLPSDLSAFPVLMVYIHKDITPAAEMSFIAYAKNGGKLILLHHSISSGKRKNKDWFSFLNISLPEGDFAAGAYKYFDPASFTVANIAPGNFITTNKVTYPETITFDRTECPAFTLQDTEVYLNHVFTGPRTLLLGIQYLEKQSGRTYMQPTAGWSRPAEKGTVMYFMPGHKAGDFDNPTYAQILANAVIGTNGNLAAGASNNQKRLSPY